MLRLCGTDSIETQWMCKYKFLLGESNTITTTANNATNTIIKITN